MNNLPETRRARLKQIIENKEYIRVMEASNGLTGLIVENTKVNDKEYDAMWISSLCDSTLKGKQDNEVVDFTSRIDTINEIMEVTTKPIIIDGDTGGKGYVDKEDWIGNTYRCSFMLRDGECRRKE